MPAIPESTRSSIVLRLLDHAGKNWPQLAKVRARYHGSFAYITGVLRDGEQIPLFRLRYGGSAHSFGFAIYSPARDRYDDAVLLTGLPIGSPQEALDTACTIHLTGLGANPNPDPRRTYGVTHLSHRPWGKTRAFRPHPRRLLAVDRAPIESLTQHGLRRGHYDPDEVQAFGHDDLWAPRRYASVRMAAARSSPAGSMDFAARDSH
jgi:hypothetical protein